MNGVSIMLKSMGLDPEKIESAIELVTSQISKALSEMERQGKELERQGKLLDSIAAALNINGDANQPRLENENGQRHEFAGNSTDANYTRLERAAFRD